jgi:hypothetical protein
MARIVPRHFHFVRGNHPRAVLPSATARRSAREAKSDQRECTAQVCKAGQRLGCRAGLVVAVTDVEAGQVQFAVDQMVQRRLVSMGLWRAMGGSNMNFTFDTCYSIGFTAECAYGIIFSTASLALSGLCL